MSDKGERCDKCGEHGEDRRTLWMACMCMMSELPVPFTEDAILGKRCEKAGEKTLPSFNSQVPVWSDPSGEERHYPFYTLRVCKQCRADWMQSIAQWFATKPTEEESCGSGIFVRERGAIREVTEDEWNEMYLNRNKEKAK